MGHGRLIVSIGIALSLTACGSDKVTTGWKSFPVTLYADSTITSSPEKLADLTDSMDYWNGQAGKQLFDFKGEWKGGQPYSGDANAPEAIHANVIFFQNPWPYPTNTVGMTTVRSSDEGFSAAMVMMNPNTEFCSGDCERETGTSERKTFAHELGHFLGLGHTNNPDNIMYPDTTPGSELSAKSIDITALKAITGN